MGRNGPAASVGGRSRLPATPIHREDPEAAHGPLTGPGGFRDRTGSAEAERCAAAKRECFSGFEKWASFFTEERQNPMKIQSYPEIFREISR